MDYIEQAVQRMKAQINDLLRYAKIAARTAPRTVVDVDDILGRVERQARDAIAASGAIIRKGALMHVIGDAPEIESVLRHLIDNAIKFRGAQAPEIEVTATKAGGLVEVVVRDNGIGIEPRHQERVFIVFQRLIRRCPAPASGLRSARRSSSATAAGSGSRASPAAAPRCTLRCRQRRLRVQP